MACAVSVTGAVQATWRVGGASTVGGRLVRYHGQTLARGGRRLSVQGARAGIATGAGLVATDAICHDARCAFVAVRGWGAGAFRRCALSRRGVAIATRAAITVHGAGLRTSGGYTLEAAAVLRGNNCAGAVAVAGRRGGEGLAVAAARCHLAGVARAHLAAGAFAVAGAVIATLVGRSLVGARIVSGLTAEHRGADAIIFAGQCIGASIAAGAGGRATNAVDAVRTRTLSVRGARGTGGQARRGVRSIRREGCIEHGSGASSCTRGVFGGRASGCTWGVRRHDSAGAAGAAGGDGGVRRHDSAGAAGAAGAAQICVDRPGRASRAVTYRGCAATAAQAIDWATVIASRVDSAQSSLATGSRRHGNLTRASVRAWYTSAIFASRPEARVVTRTVRFVDTLDLRNVESAKTSSSVQTKKRDGPQADASTRGLPNRRGIHQNAPVSKAPA